MAKYSRSKAMAGRGSQFFLGGITGANGFDTFQLVGELSETNLSAIKWALEDVSNFQSGHSIERMSTMADPGTVSIKYNYIAGDTDAGQVAFDNALDSGEPYDCRIVLVPNPKISQVSGDRFEFSAFVSSGGELAVGVKTAITGSAELTITGDRTKTAGSILVLSSTPNPAAVGAPVTLTATMSGDDGPTITGTVQFYDGPNPLGAPVTLVAGVATLTTSALTAGTHSIIATYTPAENTSFVTASSAVVSQLITAAAPAPAPAPAS